MKKAGTIVLGGVAAAAPLGAGITVFLDPLKKEIQSGDFIQVGTLKDLPRDGVPRKFTVVAERSDAWNKYPQTPIGAIYLRRTPDNRVAALNVICPHAGCFVDYRPARDSFFCPCHNSAFALDGSVDDPNSPSARGMDELEVEVRNELEIWVKFQNFRMGTPEKIPLA